MGGVSRNGKIYDVTRPLAPGCVVYPGDIVPRLVQQDQGMYRVTDIRISSHSGTHIDAPSHYIEEGTTVDELPFSALMGWCRVVDLSGVEGTINPDNLGGVMDGPRKVLLRTSFSHDLEFREDYPSLGQEAAAVLAARGIDCIGTDGPSIETFDCSGQVHRTLLASGVVIIELLDLRGVPEGDYWMIALPLRLRGLDGSPCRVLLFEGWDEVPAWTLFKTQ